MAAMSVTLCSTLFLDETGEIPLDLKAKLLHLLQVSEIEQIDEEWTRRSYVRVIAATSRNLRTEAGTFRQAPLID